MSSSEYRISDKDFFTGKKVLVMGLGRFGGGVDASKFACKAGAKVTITDLSSAEQLSGAIDQLKEFGNIEYHLGSHIPADFEEADVVIVNPAVTPNNKFLAIAQRVNKFITSQINIFFELCPAKIIGITGANGKSTTTALTVHLLRGGGDKKQYGKVWLGGNIGNQPLLAEIERIEASDLVVLELSSFQAEQLGEIPKGPYLSVLTNLTPNHLDRHGSFEDYCAAKENLFKFQELNEGRPCVSIFNAEDEIAVKWYEKYKSQNGRVCLTFSADDVNEEIKGQFTLPGKANLSNLAAAMAVAKYFGVNEKQIGNCLGEFKSLAHRLELVRQVEGVGWYDDSIATTPVSAIAALEAFAEPKIIIAGGYDKGLGFDELGAKIAQNAKAAILMGATAKKIADAIASQTQTNAKIEFANSLAEAVEKAREIAVSGDVVLLSPGCASYDMFDNFQQRGDEFSQQVRQIPTASK